MPRPFFAWIERNDGRVELVDVWRFTIQNHCDPITAGYRTTLVAPDDLILHAGDRLRVDVKLPEAFRDAVS